MTEKAAALDSYAGGRYKRAGPAAYAVNLLQLPLRDPVLTVNVGHLLPPGMIEVLPPTSSFGAQ